MAISSFSSYTTTNMTGVMEEFKAYAGESAYTRMADQYDEEDEVIKVDKGSPDKALYAIFYAEIEDIREPEEDHDPVIFCKTKAEVDKEMTKLLKRRDVDFSSVRIFGLVGVVNIEVKIDQGLMKEEKKEKK